MQHDAAIPKTPEERRAILQLNYDGCRDALGELALLQEERPTPEQAEQIRLTQIELDGRAKAIELFDLACERATRRAASECRENALVEVKRLRNEVAGMSGELPDLVRRIVEQLEDIGPRLAQFVELVARRRNAALGAVRLATGDNVKAARLLSSGIAGDDHDNLATALIGAVVRSGLGQIGPNLSPHVLVNPPMQIHATDLASALRGLGKTRERLLQAIDAAVADSATQEE